MPLEPQCEPMRGCVSADVLVSPPALPLLPLLRAGFEASGSGRWLMRTIVDRGLDQANGFRLQIALAGDQVRAGLQATEACLAAATADVVDTDWLSIARCRRAGIALAAAVPYGAIFGGLVTRRGSFPALPDLPGRRIGVIHPDDKNWLLLRAACRALHGFDPESACTRVDAGSKTTLRGQLADGSVDAALLYWHQIPALVASGDFVEVCDLLDLLPLLGVRTVPSTFFVFSDALLAAQPDLVRGFARAVSAATRMLRDDAGAWHAVTGTVTGTFATDAARISTEPHPLTCSARIRLQADTVTQADGMPSETPASPPALSRMRERVGTGHDEVKTSSCQINNDAGGRALRAKWLARIRPDWDSAMRTDLLKLAHCMGESELPDGVFAAGFL